MQWKSKHVNHTEYLPSTNQITIQKSSGTIIFDDERDLAPYIKSGSGNEDYPYIVTIGNSDKGGSYQIIFQNIISHVIIQGIIIDCKGSGFGIEIQNASNTAWVSNEIKNCQKGIYIRNSSDVNIGNNLLTNNVNGIEIVDSSYVIVEQNRLENSNYGILCERCTNSIIRNNIIEKTTSSAISLLLNNFIEISRNTINQAGMYEWAAIRARNSTEITIQHNFIKTTRMGNSIYLVNTNDSLIFRNEMSDYDFVGIRIAILSTNNTIEENVFFMYGESGVFLEREFGYPPNVTRIKKNDFFSKGVSIVDHGYYTVLDSNYYSDYNGNGNYYPESLDNIYDANPSDYPNHAIIHQISELTPNNELHEVSIQWQPLLSLFNDNSANYTLYYSIFRDPNLNLIIEGLTDTSYLWDTSSIPSGNYCIMVYAFEENGLTYFDKSNTYITLYNSLLTSTETSIKLKIALFYGTPVSALTLLAILKINHDKRNIAKIRHN